MLTKWANIAAGTTVELKGKRYKVAKIKVKGKVAKVTLIGADLFQPLTREVDAKAKVEVPAMSVKGKSKTASSSKPGPLYDDRGAQTRWAEENEGDPKATKPPKKAKGGKWTEPRDKAEKAILKHLDGKLVGETFDPAVGHYVPPVDTSTVLAHLFLYHGIEPDPVEKLDLWHSLGMHDDLHERAKVAPFSPLKVNHWHTKERPTP